MRKYYEAYDDRYRQVHDKQLQWASDNPTELVCQIMEKYGVDDRSAILELGCGEGRDAVHLLRSGFPLTATDISPEAIRYCRNRWPEFEAYFQVLDCIDEALTEEYDFIYAVALIHMLVEDGDREAFYRFIRAHLKKNGIALVCTMGDGTIERQSDVSEAFDLQERTHEGSRQKLMLAGTSCRMVDWGFFLAELQKNNLKVLEYGLTEAPPDFDVMMYAVVK